MSLKKIIYEREIELGTFRFAVNAELDLRRTLYQHIFRDERTEAMRAFKDTEFFEQYEMKKDKQEGRYFITASYWMGEE